jgi:hypothetical protein
VGNREADLIKYAVKICKKAGVNPEDNIFDGTFYSKQGLIFPYKHLVIMAFMANWDPVYNANALEIITKKSKFIKFCKTAGLASGAPPDSLLIKYLNLAKVYIKQGLLLLNFNHVSYIEDKIKSISPPNSPVIIYGSPGVFKYSVAKIIHDLSKRSKAPFEVIDCSHYHDDQLCSAMFGTVKKNDSNHRLGKIDLADKGTIYIKNLQNSGNYFQSKLYTLLNDGIYSKEGSTEIKRSNTRIICSRELNNEDFITYRPKLNDDLFYCLFSNHINMPPLSYVRSNIPLLIYLCFELAILKSGLSGKIKNVEIPYYLIKYWLTEEKWGDNYLQIQYSCNHYFNEYFEYLNAKDGKSERPQYKKILPHATGDGLYYIYHGKLQEKHSKMFDYIQMSDSTEIISYLSSSDIDPYFTVTHKTFLSYPFFSYAIVTHKSNKIKPEIDYSAYRDFSPFQIDFIYENKWMPRRDLYDKDETPDSIKQVKSTLGRLEKDQPNIKSIVVEIDEKTNKFKRMLVHFKNKNKAIPLKLNLKQKAGLSLLVFLIYENSKIVKKDDLYVKFHEWDIDWLRNLGELKFPPFLTVCKWFGYNEKDWDKHEPGWWFDMGNVRTTRIKLSPILEKNDVVPNIITIKTRLDEDSVYKLHEDIEAKIDFI